MERKDVIFDVETAGLDPLQNRIAAIGIKTAEEELTLMDQNESIVLNRFWQYLEMHKNFRLIGFNNSTFDLPFLNVRSLLHKVKVIDVRGKLVDLRFILSYGNKYAKGRLEDYAALIGVEQKYNGWNGAHAVILWQQGQFSELREYLLQDIRMTYSLYERSKEIGLI